MFRLLSFIYPITKKVKSEFNETLEITWYNGKKHLNTKNANYSYGALQKILQIGLKKFDISRSKDILVLGFGGGSVIKTLRKKFKYKHSITAVDIDPVIIQLANKEFKLSQTENLNIVCADANEFMLKNKITFDLIIVDLFIDTKIPSPFFEISFWENVVKACTNDGGILFNASLENTNENDIINIASFLYKNDFQVEKLERVNKTNTLLIAKR